MAPDTRTNREDDSGQGRNFGSVAEQYDRGRPGYPEALIDALWEYAGLVPGDRGLEIGAGTGQATMSLAARGLKLLAIEPSTEMVEILNHKLSAGGHDGQAIATDFESAELDESAFELIYAATSWHWLEPARRFSIASRAIAPGGTLAVLWTWPRWRATDHREELDGAYGRSGAPLATMGPMHPVEPDPGALSREWSGEIERSDAFAQPVGKLLDWSEEYSAASYTELLGTYGDHIALEPGVRAELFADIEEIVNSAGGAITLDYRTLLLMASSTHP